MALKNLKQYTIVATFLTPGVTAGAGGWAFVNGKWVRVPPRGIRQMQAAYHLLEAGAAVADKALALQMGEAAAKLAIGAMGRG